MQELHFLCFCTAACLALFAAAAYDHHEASETYEDIDQSFKPAHAAKDFVYQVEVKCSNKAPIEGTHHDERTTYLVRNTSFPHRGKVKNK